MLSNHVLLCLVRSLCTVVIVLVDHLDRDRPSPTGVNSRTGDRSTGKRWVAACLANKQQLYVETRLRPEVFEELCRRLQGHIKDGRSIAIEEKVLTFLYVVGQGSSLRNVSYRCGRSLSTISTNFHEVLRAVLLIYKDLVTPAAATLPAQIYDDDRRWPYFAGCLGALDGTHLKLWVPADDARRYRNHHGVLTQNVLAVVDFDLKFTYVLAGWEGSAHDGRVFKDALEKGLSAPPGMYYLADGGYVNTAITMVPYQRTRYHLREIAQLADRRPQTQQELFNYRHAGLRNAVERAFGVFKRRWRVFDRPHEFNVETQVKLVYACAAVHNLIGQYGRVDEDFDALGELESEDETISQQEAKNLINLPSVSPEMEQRRERVAEALWDDYHRWQRAYGR